MPSVAVFGSTGAVGGQILRAAVALPYERVHEVGRRSAELGGDKMTFRAVDFEAIDKDDALRKLSPDVVISALGTTRAQAGSAAAFRRIDHDYVVDSARVLRDSSKPNQRLVYCSSRGASAGSPFLYPQSKGQTERDLASLGYGDTIVFRPGYLANANRARTRALEHFFGNYIIPVLAKVGGNVQIPVERLGPAMAKAGLLGSKRLAELGIGHEERSGDATFHLIGNDEALKLADMDV